MEKYESEDIPLFDARTFLGRTVWIIQNVIQPDFTLEDDPDDLVA